MLHGIKEKTCLLIDVATPNVVLHGIKEKTCLLIDVATPNDANANKQKKLKK